MIFFITILSIIGLNTAQVNYNRQLSPDYEHHVDYCSLSADFLSSILGGTIHSGKSNVDHIIKYTQQIIRSADQLEELTLRLVKPVKGAKGDLLIHDTKTEFKTNSESIKQLVSNTRGVMRALGVIEDEEEIRKTAELILAKKYKEAVQHTKTLLIEGGIYTAISLVYDKYKDVHESANSLFRFTDELVRESQMESASITFMAIFKLILQSDQVYSSLTLRFAEAVKYAMEQLEVTALTEELHRKIQATFLFIQKMIPLGVTKLVWGQVNVPKQFQHIWCLQNKFNGHFLFQKQKGVISHESELLDPNKGAFELIATLDRFYIKTASSREYVSVQYLFDEKRKPRRSMYATPHHSVANVWAFEPSNFDEFFIQTEHNDETTYLVGSLNETDKNVYAYRGKDVKKLAEQLNPSQLTWILKKCY